MSIAFVFPGQGSQEVGMGRALAEASSAARAVFTEADAAFPADRPSLSTLCFDGPIETLSLTANTQPALLATSIAALRAFAERAPDVTPAFVAGHSLGEYSALVAARCLTLADALRLVRLRGTFMQDAVAPGVGAMAAVLALPSDDVRALCDEAARLHPGEVVSPANYNSPGQIVVAGHAAAVATVVALAAERRGRAMMLNVSAPFHCSLMGPAAPRLDAALATVEFAPLHTPLVANVDAAPNTDVGRVRDLLVRQVVGAVRWDDSVRAMVAAGVDTFVEFGAGQMLRNMIRRIHKPARVLNVADVESLEATVNALAALATQAS